MIFDMRRSLLCAAVQGGEHGVSWSTGTDEEITELIQLADAGIIDLTDYWPIGATRTVHVSATAADSARGIEAHAEQDIELVLMDNVCDGFTLTGTNKKPHFIVGMKNGLLETGQMNTGGINAGGWRDCKRRSWCNTEFRNSLPATVMGWFKQFTWHTGKGGEVISGLYETNDYFGLPPTKAVFGNKYGSYEDEAALYTQWGWYKASTHRIKKAGLSGPVKSWWEASPYADYAFLFCNVSNTGGEGYAGAASSILLSPFGCI